MGKLVTTILFAVISGMWLLTQVTSGWWSWAIAVGLLYLLVVLPVLLILSRILALQEGDKMAQNRYDQLLFRSQPYSRERRLKQSSVGTSERNAGRLYR